MKIFRLKADNEIKDSKLKSHISESDYKERLEQVKSCYEKKVHALKVVMVIIVKNILITFFYADFYYSSS